MRTSRFLVTTLFTAISVMPLLGQGLSAVPAKTAPQNLSAPDAVSKFTVRQTAPGSFTFEVQPGANKLDNEEMKELLSNPQALSMMMKSSTLCYSMEGYRFTRPDPTSDTTKLAGRSTCQPSRQFQSKNIVVKPGDAAAR